MGIGRVASWNRMSSLTDTKSKSIQKEITDVQQQIQKLPSKEEFSANEKANERKKLQKEISSLNIELKLYQEELLKSQKREVMMAELQEKRENSADKTDKDEPSAAREQKGPQGTVITKNTDGTVILKEEMNRDGRYSAETPDEKKENIETDMAKDAELSRKEMHAVVSADNSLQRAGCQGVVIARIRDGIAILKGEIKQDERHGADTEKKQAEFEKMEKKEQRARTFQFSALGEANQTMRSAAKIKAAGPKDNVQNHTENSAVKFLGEEQAARQKFHISFGN